MVNDEVSASLAYAFLLKMREVLGHVNRQRIPSDIEYALDCNFARKISEVGILNVVESKAQLINYLRDVVNDR